MTRLLLLLLTLTVSVSQSVGADDDRTVEQARSLWQTGEYEAAAETYEQWLDEHDAADPNRVAALLGLSHAQQSRGLWEAAAGVIDSGLELTHTEAELLARKAELAYLRGDYEAAAESADAALRQHEEQLLARLVKAHLATDRGDFDAALDGYVWFVRYYNREQPTDAETLLHVGEGSLQYARWKSVSGIFNFVVNTLSVDALADDKRCWQASLMAGELFLEKFNKPQAQQEFAAALAINPRAAEVIVAQGRAALVDYKIEEAIGFAQQALEINPALPASLLLAADASIAAGDLKAAMTFIKQAREINPVDQRMLARLAGVFLLDDGVLERDVLETILAGEFDGLSQNVRDSRFVKTYRKVLEQTPKPGLFLNDLGDILDGHRKYDAAEVCFRRAIQVMPQLSQPRTSLGMLAMRTGDLQEARSILDAAFEADRFHVRVSNMRKVLGQLAEYDTVTSEHFVIRVPQDQRLLGEAMADYLEETYDELTALFGYEPETRTQFEVFGPAGGNSAHQWFSARMVGLPWVQTIGASTGMIVAMASPNNSHKPFNWARVVRHEFVHILTLQQTRFNIPHWYTEALAVRTEGVTPPEWDTMLLRRVPAGEVFTLADINAGFQRPEKPEDWQMAYCQSWLYANYITEEFGATAHQQFLDAYRRNLSTASAVAEACGVNIDEFESGYTDYLNAYVDSLRGSRVPPPPSVEEAQAHWRENPTDRDAQAELAWAMWNEGRKREAHDIAKRLLEDSPELALAIAIVAEARLQNDETAAAEDLLRAHFDADNPQPELMERVAMLYMAQQNWRQAAELWRTAADRWPREPRFLKGLAASLLRLDDETALRPVLAKLTQLDTDDALSRKKLATLAHAGEDWPAVLQWATESLHIDITDETMHRVLADAYEATGHADAAEYHRQIAGQLTERIQ